MEAERSDAFERESERPVREATVFIVRKGTKSRRAGVRASIVGMKRRNGRGPKGRRKVDASGEKGCTNTRCECRKADPHRRSRAVSPSESSPTQRTHENHGKDRDATIGCLGSTCASSADLAYGRGIVPRKAANHRLESRMRETRSSGLAGGEAESIGLPYPDHADAPITVICLR